MARVLAVDLGSSRIGVALSDPSRTLASPLTTIVSSGDGAADRKTLISLAREHDADTIVVGMPVALSGERGAAARRASAEIDALRAEAGTDLRIVSYDERMTTVTAQRLLTDRGVRVKQQRSRIDQAAAAVILQAYLESQA